MDSEIKEHDLSMLAGFLDNVELYSRVLKLTLSERAEVMSCLHPQAAMLDCLSKWIGHNPSKATFRELLDVVRRK